MESPAIARYIPQKSKKRVFPGGSSSCVEPDVMEIAPPMVDQTAKSNSKSESKRKGKQKKVSFHEIIDVDMDEDRNDVVFIEGKVESNKKKGSKGILLGPRSASQYDSKDTGNSAQNVESNKKGKGVVVEPSHSSKSSTPGSDNFFDLDDYVLDDDYWALQAHFDNMDLPTGIEAPIPWLPEFSQMKKTHPTPSKPLVTSHAQFAESQSQPDFVDPFATSAWLPSSNNNPPYPFGSIYSNPMTQGSHKKVPTHNMPPNHTKSGSGFYFSDYPTTLVDNGSSSFSTAFSPGAGKPYSKWRSLKSIKQNLAELKDAMFPEPDYGEIYSMEDALVDQDFGNGPSPAPGPVGSNLVGSSSSLAKLDNGDILKKYESFKKFDTVVDFSDHFYSHQSSAVKPPKNWAKKIQDEWRILEKDLPDTIFVRVYESRMDLLRAVIIGAEGTPYHDGLFFFDVCFPSSYPNSPPLVKYHSGGLRINPNLYNCGKVCLSLLNTWTGGQKEKWLPGTSTMLQVLVSIQGLILNMKPYFNEPGYAHSSGTPQGEKRSLQYNESTLILSLKTMVYTMNKPPKYFEELVVGHFRNRVRDILMACKAYTEGVQVGCLVKGGVQDVDEDNDTCSPKFKNDVITYVKVLIGAFKKIGAKEADEFLFLSEKKKHSTASAKPKPKPKPKPNSNANANAPPVVAAAAAAAHSSHGYPPFPFSPPISAYNHHW